MVYYRKYRPQTISDLDNAHVRETLYAVLSGKSVAHAFLFTGPKGLGKTSTARIIAKAINCKGKGERGKGKEKNIEPCNKCEQCISITNGTNLDVLEIDGASNRGIDEIRDLREKIRLSPLSAKKKVYIIDEVHMLTTEAFNALLKTLEEPPSHAVFILCTTEPHKVPPTIASRCLHIPFTKATTEELVRSFKRIAEGEKISVSNKVLTTIASMSDGSFRDGAKIFEELVSLANGKEITEELIEQKYQISNIKHQVINLLNVLKEKDTKEGLLLIGKIPEQGIDIKYFIEQLINELHEHLLYKIGVQNNNEFSIFNFQFSIDEVKVLIELLTKAHGEIKYAVLPQLPLEMVVIEYSLEKEAGHISHVAKGADAQVAHENFHVQGRGPVKSSFPASAPSSLASFAGANEVRAVGSPPAFATPTSGENRSSDDLLYKLIDSIKSQNQSVAGLLRGCKIKSFSDKEFVLETAYKFHKEKLEEKNTKMLLEKAVSEITGNNDEVLIVLR